MLSIRPVLIATVTLFGKLYTVAHWIMPEYGLSVTNGIGMALPFVQIRNKIQF